MIKKSVLTGMNNLGIFLTKSFSSLTLSSSCLLNYFTPVVVVLLYNGSAILPKSLINCLA